MIYIIKGDILAANEKYIAHQCNAISKNAAGVAAALFNQFPHSNIYADRTKPDLPGHIIIRGDGIKDRFVIGMVAQHYPGGPDNKSLLDSSKDREGYFWHCLMQIAKIKDLESVALPLHIGCGLAKGNWNTYHRMLNSFSIIVNATTKTNVVLYDNRP